MTQTAIATKNFNQ